MNPIAVVRPLPLPNVSERGTFAALNLGGAEILLLLMVLLVLSVLAIGFIALIYFIIRAATNRSAPKPAPAPNEVDSQKQRVHDLEHIRLLAIFHFVFGGLAVLGIAFLGVHYAIMRAVFTNPEMWKSQAESMPPRAFFEAFTWFYLLAAVLILAVLALNVLSGVFLLQKKHRTFSLVVAAIDCLQIPFGTALGVFTMIVLLRQTVPQLYGINRPN
jgi:hypothetical protein